MSHLMEKIDFCYIILPGDLMVGLEQMYTAEGVIVHKHNVYHYISVFVFQSWIT